ncbi:YybH family protein [Undibacterium sp. TJN25]|uniref:YybH family protein n=1 Tax=Undibacterium sp. TJN25 TaxID=3413056 RepID=UPI003BF3DF16
MNDLDSRILLMLNAYKAAVFSKDVDAFMRLYDDRVRVFDTWGVWSYEGAAAWRGMIEEWFSSLGTEKVLVNMDEVQVVAGTDLATVSAIGSYAAISAEGVSLRAMQNRLTWVLKLEGGAWKIVHEHTSAPVGFEDTKAILKR